MPVSSSVLPFPLDKVHPNYLVSITGTDELGNTIGNFQGFQYANQHYGIIAVMPEEFAISTSSSWIPLLNSMAQQSLGQLFAGLGKTASDITQAVSGFSPIGAAFTQLVWEATTPIEFRLPLTFNAVYDAEVEVMLPIMQLLSMTLPSVGGDLFGIDLSGAKGFQPLWAPGPNLSGRSKYKVTINIGQAFSFANVLIKSVNATFKTLPVDSGDFISADVELEISTTRILTKSDLANYFRHTQATGNSVRTIG